VVKKTTTESVNAFPANCIGQILDIAAAAKTARATGRVMANKTT
jgi:hypothetical protein